MDTMLREFLTDAGNARSAKIVDKPVCGRITLSAGRADDEVVITLIGGAVDLDARRRRDDGARENPDALRRTTLARSPTGAGL
jgi:hypothetical protein